MTPKEMRELVERARSAAAAAGLGAHREDPCKGLAGAVDDLCDVVGALVPPEPPAPSLADRYGGARFLCRKCLKRVPREVRVKVDAMPLWETCGVCGASSAGVLCVVETYRELTNPWQ